MSAVKKLVRPGINRKILKQFIPLNKLTPLQLTEISEKSSIIEFARGRTLFTKGDVDKSTYFLVSGEIEFTSGQEKISIKSGSNPAKNVLFDSRPRPVTAIAKTRMSVLCVDSGLLEVLLGDYHHHNYEVNEIDGEENTDWMTRFIQSLTTLSLPAQNMQALMMRMKEITVKAGDTVIEQSDHDNFYYIVKQGRCVVSRRSSSRSPDVNLVELDEGDGFGEEALISNDERSATVKMINDGTLMRLDKKDFLELLASPILHTASYDEAVLMVANGAQFLDIREIGEHARDGITNSINIPLPALRAKLKGFDNKRKYIVYSENENRSAAAGFLLAQAGIDNIVLKGGISTVPASAKSCFMAASKIKNESTPVNDISGPAVVSLHPEKTSLPRGLSQTANNSQNEAKLKDNAKLTVNNTDEQDLVARAQSQTEKEREIARIALDERNAAKAEIAQLKEEIYASNNRAREKNKQFSDAEQELVEKLNLERERNSKEILELRHFSEQRLRKKLDSAQQEAERELNELRLSGEKSDRKLAEFKEISERQVQQKLEEVRKISEQEIEEFKQKKARSDQELKEFRINSEKQKEQLLDEVRKESEHDLIELKAQAQLMREKYEEESSKLRVKEEALDSSRDELRVALEDREKIKSDNDLLARKIDTVFSRANDAEQARELALQENDTLKAEMNTAELETQEQYKRLLVENTERLQNDLNEIMSKMTNEKNRAFAAEEALRRAKEREAQLRADAEASRLTAEKETEKLAQIQQEKILELEQEILAVEEAERLQRETDKTAERLKREADESKKRAEEEARKYAIAEAARQKALKTSQKNIKKTELARERAESGTSRLRAELEATRVSAEEALKKAAELESERRLEENNIKKQSEMLAALEREEDEKRQVVMSEQARVKAEKEIEKLKNKLESQKRTALTRAKKRAEENAAIEQRKKAPASRGGFSANESIIIPPDLLADNSDSPGVEVGNVRKSGWISDALLWETTLGMREDEEAELVLSPEKAAKPSKPKTAQVKAKQPDYAAMRAKSARSNPNISTFSAREVGSNGPNSHGVSLKVDMPVARQGNSIVKKALIGSFIGIIVAVGAGLFVMNSGEESGFSESLSGLFGKTASVDSDVASADKITDEGKVSQLPSGRKPEITASQFRMRKERAEMNARSAAQAEFSRLKKKMPVVSQSTLRPDIKVESKNVASEPVDSTPVSGSGRNVLPTVKQEEIADESVQGTVSEVIPEVTEESTPETIQEATPEVIQEAAPGFTQDAPQDEMQKAIQEEMQEEIQGMDGDLSGTAGNTEDASPAATLPEAGSDVVEESVDSGETLGNENTDVDNEMSIIEMTIESIENATEDDGQLDSITDDAEIIDTEQSLF